MAKRILKILRFESYSNFKVWLAIMYEGVNLTKSIYFEENIFSKKKERKEKWENVIDKLT